MIKCCIVCKKDFKISPSRVKIGKGKFCSRLCADHYRHEKKMARKTNCLVCGRVFLPATTSNAGIYCSLACLKIGSNYKFQNRWSRKYKQCVNCGTTEKEYVARGLCITCYAAEEYKNNKKMRDRREGYRLKSFNLGQEEYDDLLREQEGKCAICSRSVEENKKRLAIDHNHKNNKVRGLLCSSCNFALGLLGDNPCLILKMLNYILSTADGDQYIKTNSFAFDKLALEEFNKNIKIIINKDSNEIT